MKRLPEIAKSFSEGKKEVSIEPSMRQGEGRTYFSGFFGCIQNIHYVKVLENHAGC
jgi:ribosomal protein L21E